MSEWISVKDRLPIDDSRYLVWHSYFDVALVANFAPYAPVPDFSIPMSASVTHWQPLPAPPD